METSNISGSSFSSYFLYGALALIAAGILYLFYSLFSASKKITEMEKALDSHSRFLSRVFEPEGRKPPPKKSTKKIEEEPPIEENEFQDTESVMTEKTFAEKE